MKEIVYTFWKNRDINDLEGEVWKDIPNTDGFYQASNLGRIKSFIRRYYYTYEDGKLIKNRVPLILSQVVASNGYLVVGIKYPNVKKVTWELVHRLICSTFKDKVDDKPFVHHRKNVRTYNKITNLEWVTPQENSIYIKTEHGNYEVVDTFHGNNALSVPQNTMKKKGITYIYAILDDEKSVIYIGRAADPHVRFRMHKSKKVLNGRDYWIQKHLSEGKEVDFLVLRLCEGNEWIYWEKYYISEYRKTNPLLNNIADGGFDNSRETIDAKAKKLYKPVLQYSRDGVFMREWESVKSASISVNVNTATMSGGFAGGALTGGFLWKIKKSNDYPLNITPYKYMRDLPVLQYGLDGILIKEWESAGIAKRDLGNVSTSAIYSCIKSEVKTAGGYIWKLKKGLIEPTVLYEPPKRTFKPIFKILANGSKVRFNSIKDAANDLGITSTHIMDCIRNNKPAAGFYFEKDLSADIWKHPHGKLPI